MNPDIKWVQELSPDLFWDVAQGQVDGEKNCRWLVERVLTRGRLEDWRVLSAHVDAAALGRILPQAKLAPRERHFLERFVGRADA